MVRTEGMIEARRLSMAQAHLVVLITNNNTSKHTLKTNKTILLILISYNILSILDLNLEIALIPQVEGSPLKILVVIAHR
jgi:hypothetical protein